MEPIRQTSEAIEEFGPFLERGEDLLEQLREMGRKVREIVPECVGLSLASRESGVSFTLVASDEFIAALDGLQYLDGGPCVSAVEEERVLQFPDDEVLDEGTWQLFSRGTAAASVASTLTLPILVDGEVTGSVNLYAASADAFYGHHEELAAVVGGWAPGAVANADLSFSTRRTAEDAPRVLFEEMRLQVAVGILVATWDISVEAALERLQDAAARAGIPETDMARTIIDQALQDTADEGDADQDG
jgi:GAF domain-containing protein